MIRKTMRSDKTLAQIVREGAAALAKADIPDALFDARCLAETCFGVTRTQLLARGEAAVSPERLESYQALLARRIGGEPLQYLLGEWEFMGMRFLLGDGVLIPRPETELLAAFARSRLADQSGAVIWDLCAGSGCVGISCAAFSPDATVYLVEKSEQALLYLKKNVALHHLTNCHIIQADIMRPGSLDALPPPTLILSNPPYIPSAELPVLQREVRKEPKMALDGGRDGLDFYPCLAGLLPRLTSDGAMAVECGEGQAVTIQALFEAQGFVSKCIPDGNEILRIVTAYRPKNGTIEKSSHLYG